MGITDRLQHAWNAFFNRDPTKEFGDYGFGYSYRPDRVRFTRGNERSVVTAVYNRIALDVAAIKIQHANVDEDGHYLETISPSSLNDCFNIEANIDQSGRAFVQDIVMSMMDEGCVAVVPIDTDSDIEDGTYTIYTMRTAKIKQWYPQKVKLEAYDDRVGVKKEFTSEKRTTAIIENPLYAVMNEPNSTLQRLIRKLNLLDAVDEQSSSGKLDLIIQLPYVVRNEAKRLQAEKRSEDIEKQLSGSKYGIAYTDGTERITQLNRPVENNLMKQIEYLTSMLYSQLGITQSVLDGTADEKTMLNYYDRTVEPFISAITDEMKRKFLTKKTRTQGQSITFFRDPFRLVPVSQLAEIGDKFTRNEILSSNEVRQIIGRKPSKDKRADELKNKNLRSPEDETPTATDNPSEEENQNE